MSARLAPCGDGGVHEEHHWPDVDGMRWRCRGRRVSRLAGYDVALSCGTESARRRHVIKGEACADCGVSVDSAPWGLVEEAA